MRKSIQNILLINVLFIIFSFLHTNIFAQLAFDVKTTIEEKTQLHVIKLGVINSIQQSNWATVKEIGENYSLWLTNLQRHYIGDSILTEYDIDLRTPAMLSRGSHIASRHISVIFDTSGISNIRSTSDTLLTTLVVEGINNSKFLDEIIDIFPSSIPYGDIFIRPLVAKVLNEIKRQPTPLEILEANLVATNTIVELEFLFKELSKNKTSVH